MAHCNDFTRVAVVGEGTSMNWGYRLANIVTKAELRRFDPSDMDAAIAWARGGEAMRRILASKPVPSEVCEAEQISGHHI